MAESDFPRKRAAVLGEDVGDGVVPPRPGELGRDLVFFFRGEEDEAPSVGGWVGEWDVRWDVSGGREDGERTFL